MPRGNINRAEMGPLYVKGLDALSGARLNNDVAKPGDGSFNEGGPVGDVRASLGDQRTDVGGAFENLDVRDGRSGDSDGPGVGSVFGGAGETFALPARFSGATMDNGAAQDAVEAAAALPGRVCGPLGESTGDVALDSILAKFEGMTRFEVRAEMRDWDRAELREFRSDFFEHFGQGFFHADWLWG